MIECPLCLNKVSKLKTNSHVIPRWIAKDTKNENGQNILLNIKENKVKSNQTDYKGDYVCSKCEDLFRDFDTYGSRVYKLKQGFTKGSVNNYSNSQNNKNFATVQMLDLKGHLLWKFFISILVRHHLYSLKYLKIDVLGSDYSVIQKMIFEKKPDLSLYPIRVFLHPEEKTSVSYPHSFKSGNSTIWRFSGYNFTADICISPETNDNLPEFSIQEDSLIMVGLPFEDTHLFSTIKKFASNHKAIKGQK